MIDEYILSLREEMKGGSLKKRENDDDREFNMILLSFDCAVLP